jgi:hypothetical protein
MQDVHLSQIYALWPYAASFLIAFVICLIDLSVTASDKVRHPVSPLICWGCRIFLIVNGSVAIVLYYIADTNTIDLLTLPSWTFTGPWKHILTAGLAAPFLSKSKLVSLKGGGSFGIDAIYARKRDRCVRIIENSTRARQRVVEEEFAGKFNTDESFVLDFGKIVLNALHRPNPSRQIRDKITDVESMLATVRTNLSDVKVNEASKETLANGLIKIALEEEDIRYIESMLRHRLRYGNFDNTTRMRGFAWPKPRRRLSA